MKITASKNIGSVFESFDNSDVRLLIEKYPLAWVIAADGDEASQLPLIGVFDDENRLTELIGHFARSNPLNDAFAKRSTARIQFSGPSGYVSPAQAERSNWAPTWNYAHVRIAAEVSVVPEFTAEAVDILIDWMERDRENPWRASNLEERYERLLPMIVGFRARVIDVNATFKLGQDERPETLHAILKNLQDNDLKEWMRRLNRSRLD